MKVEGGSFVTEGGSPVKMEVGSLVKVFCEGGGR